MAGCLWYFLFIIISPVKNKKHTKPYMLNDNKVTVYIYIKHNFLKKTSGCQMKDKKSCLKALAWLELAEGYLKPCHQAPLNIKQMYVLSLSCFLLTSWI